MICVQQLGCIFILCLAKQIKFYFIFMIFCMPLFYVNLFPLKYGLFIFYFFGFFNSYLDGIIIGIKRGFWVLMNWFVQTAKPTVQSRVQRRQCATYRKRLGPGPFAWSILRVVPILINICLRMCNILLLQGIMRPVTGDYIING